MTDRAQETVDVFEKVRESLLTYEESVKKISSTTVSGIEKSLVFTPSDNLKVSFEKRKIEEREKMKPDDVKIEELPDFSKHAVEFFVQKKCKISRNYNKIKMLPTSRIEFKDQEYEIDKDQKKKSRTERIPDFESDEEDSSDLSSYSESESDEEILKRKAEAVQQKELEMERKLKEKKEKKYMKYREKLLEDKKFKEEVIKLVTPSFSGTKCQIAEHFRPYFFHLYHNLKNDEDNQWSGGAEKGICGREHTKRGSQKKVNLLIRIKKFETSFEEKYGNVEPLFLEMFLFDCKTCERVSEVFYFDFNREETISMIPRGVRFMKQKWKNKALVQIKGSFEDTYLLVILHKVLEGKEDIVLDRYVNPVKFQRKDLKKLQKSLPGIYQRLGFLRQPVAYGMFPIFDDEEKVILNDGKIVPEKQTFIRLNGNEDIMKLMKGTENMEKGNSLTGSKKIKTVQVRCKFEVLTLQPNFKPIHQGDGVLAINNRVFVKSVVPFRRQPKFVEEMKKIEFVRNYQHYLYIYPKQLIAKLSKAKNVAIRIQLKDNDDRLNDKNCLELIYGRSSQNMLIQHAYSYVTYKKKNPEFNDEFKIKLPSLISKKHHLLFVFFNVDCHTHTSKSILTRLGMVSVPLLNKDGKILHGSETLKIVMEHCNPDTGNVMQGNKIVNYNAPSTHKKEIENGFLVEFRSESTILPKLQNLATFFQRPQYSKNHKILAMPFQTDEGGPYMISF